MENHTEGHGPWGQIGFCICFEDSAVCISELFSSFCYSVYLAHITLIRPFTLSFVSNLSLLLAGFLNLDTLTLWSRSLFAGGGVVLCFAEYSAVILAFTHYITISTSSPLHGPRLWQLKMSPDIFKCFLGTTVSRHYGVTVWAPGGQWINSTLLCFSGP